MRGAASKGGPLEEVIPETWGASAQVQSPGAHLLSCLLRHSVFLEALALHTYLPLPSTSASVTGTDVLSSLFSLDGRELRPTDPTGCCGNCP